MNVIGAWTARYKGEEQKTQWHYVESEIADRLATHCGRQLHRVNRNGKLVVQEAPGYDRCAQCPQEAT